MKSSIRKTLIHGTLVACGNCIFTHASAQVSASNCANPGEDGQLSTPAIHVKVVGAELIETADIDSILETVPRPIRSWAEICKISAAIQNTYRNRGIGATAVFIMPEQTSEAARGSYIVRVIVGRLQAVKVVGAAHFTKENILAGVPALIEGEPLFLEAIDANLRMSNDSPAKRVVMLANPGDKSGAVEAELQVREEQPSALDFILDNTGNEVTGRYRTSVAWHHANLWQRDHVFSLFASTSPGHLSDERAYAIGYRVPMYTWRTFFDAFGGYSKVSTGSVTTDIGDIHFAGTGTDAGLRATYFMTREGELDRRVALSIERRSYQNTCIGDGLADVACTRATANIAATPLTIEASWVRAVRRPMTLNAAFIWNARLSSESRSDAQYELARPGAMSDFKILRAQIGAAASLYAGWQVRLRSALQWTNAPLVAGEQFGIGGGTSVRGYREREVAADRGLFAGAELEAPTYFGEYFSGSTAFVFVDAAVGRNANSFPCYAATENCHAFSFGLGSRLTQQKLHISADIGVPLQKLSNTLSRRPRLHLTARYSF